MLPICLKPMEDELLYGWFIRLSGVNGCRSAAELTDRFLVERSVSAPVKISYLPRRLDMVPGIEGICRIHGQIACFPTADEIVGKMTPLYALFPYMTYGYQARWCQFLLRDRGDFSRQERPLFSLFDQLHICPMCWEEDKKKYGFTYLRTWHHLPGVHVCAVHGIPLKVLEQKQCAAVTMDKLAAEAQEDTMIGSGETNLQISRFAKSLYENPLFFDLSGLQTMFMEKIFKMGFSVSYPYDGLEEAIRNAGFGPYLSGGGADRVRLMLSNPWQRFDEILSFSVYLFGNYREFQKSALKYCNELSGQFNELIAGSYELQTGFGPIVKLKCCRCGEIFWTHPYALARGCFCPKCESRLSPEQIINHRLRFLGDGNYRLAGPLDEGLGRTKIIHDTCGKIREMRLADAIWMGKSCKCEATVSEAGLSARINDGEFTLTGYNKEGDKRILTIRHETCGEVFQIDIRQFTRNRRCPYCDYRNTQQYTQESFVEEIKKLTGDEYSLVDVYQGKHAPVKIRHKICGTVTRMTPYEFLNGKRCDLCRNIYNVEEIRQAVEQCTGGYYHIQAVKNSYYQIEGNDGSHQKKKAGYIIQELKRTTRSPLFKVRERIFEEKESLRGKLYCSVKEACEDKGFWEYDDLMDSEFSERGIKRALKELVERRYLLRIKRGKYKINPERR